MRFLEKTQQLPREVYDYLTSHTLHVEVEKSVFLYGLPEQIVFDLAGPVGLIFVGDFFLRDLPKKLQELQVPQQAAYGVAYEINQRIFARFPGHFQDAQALLGQWAPLKSDPVISEAEAYKKVLEVEPWLIEIEKEKQEASRQAMAHQEGLEQLFILDALAKYPRLNDQNVTSERIKLRGERELARGTVRNWLRAYRDVLGVRKHTAMERGQFIFNSENTKKLSGSERDKLALLLKSLDENAPLTVDPVHQEIVFPEAPPAPTPRAGLMQSNVAPQTPAFSATPQRRPVSEQSLTSNPVSPASQGARKFNFAQSSREQVNNRAQVMHFSSKHVLPAEKGGRTATSLKVSPQQNSSFPTDPKTGVGMGRYAPVNASPAAGSTQEQKPSVTRPEGGRLRHPYRISHANSSQKPPHIPAARPSSQQKEVWQVPEGLKNVVDLRSEE